MGMIATVGVTLLFTRDIEDIKEPLFLSLERYQPYGNTSASSKDITDSWDQLQKEYHCCGVDSYTDWYNSSLSLGLQTIYPDNQGFKVPYSCCSSLGEQER